MSKWVVTINDKDCGYYVNHYATYYIVGEKPTPEDIVKLFNSENENYELVDEYTIQKRESDLFSSVEINISEYKEPEFRELGGGE